jgi:ectoine hydroxylase-related dioxygenase (phytanoyl-CoA dioxygenase family)
MFNEEQIKHYNDHGFVIVENFLSAQELAAARREIETFIPGWIDYADNPSGAKPDNWDEAFISRRSRRFPFKGAELNAITLHPELRRFASLMAAGADIFCEQSDLTYKCKGHFADTDQAMHLDYVNHTLAYPPADPAYWQTAFLVYYTDVKENQAPTAVCSWQHYEDEILWPPVYSREDRPELYDNEVRTTVPAGSVLAYSMRTFHRGTKFLEEGARIGHFISYSPAKPRWMGIVGWPEQGVYPSFSAWMESASPEERELIGFPHPEDAYWTEETLAGVAARYPAMDMRPYKK